jgi:hypothetical protein
MPHWGPPACYGGAAVKFIRAQGAKGQAFDVPRLSEET